MKKTLIFILVVALFASTCVGFSHAAAKIPVTFYVSNTHGKQGKVIPIDVVVSAETLIGAVDGYVLVPEEYFDVVSILNDRGKEKYYTVGEAVKESEGQLVASDGRVDLPDGNRGVKFAMAAMNGLWETGTLFTFYIQPKKALPSEGVRLKLYISSMAHANDKYREYDVTVVDGRVVREGTSLPKNPTLAPADDPRPPQPKPPVYKPPVRPNTSDVVTNWPPEEPPVPIVPQTNTDIEVEDIGCAEPNVEDLIETDSATSDKNQNDPSAVKQNKPIQSKETQSEDLGVETDPIEGVVATQTDVATPDVLDITAESAQSDGMALKASSDSGTDGIRSPFIVWLVVAAVVLLGGGVTLVVLLRRKKKRIK